MKKLLLSALALVICASSAFAQDFSQPLDGELLIKGNRKYYIGGVQVTRAEALEHVAPYNDVVRQINKGYRLREDAMAVGIAGGGLILAGLGVAVGWPSSGHDEHDLNDEYVNDPHPILGGVIMSIGAALGIASLGIHIAGNTAQKRAMSLYNEGGDYTEFPSRDMRLSFAPTGGGLGLQLRF